MAARKQAFWWELGFGELDAGPRWSSFAAETASPRSGPRLVGFDLPAEGTPGPGAPLVLRFDAAVIVGRGCLRLLGGAEPIKIPVRDPEHVTVEGSLVRVEPPIELAPGTSYRLRVGPKAFLDPEGRRPIAGRDTLHLDFTVAPASQEGEPGATWLHTWTIMVYLAADNDLDRYALLDLAEMERVQLPGSVALVALVDRSPWSKTGVNAFTDTRRGPVRPDGDPTRVGSELVSIGEQNTGDPATLTAFIDWAASAFPAERYGLVIWNHGGGLDGVGWDVSSRGDRLELSEVRRAITDSVLDKVDLLGFDACLMAMVEVAAELRTVADVLVASQELEPAKGWAYDRWLKELARHPAIAPDELARAIVETYAQTYPNERAVTLSAVDLRTMPALESALGDLATAVLRSDDPATLAGIRTAVERARPFPRDGSYPYRDLGEFLGEAIRRVDDPLVDDAARRALAALEEAVTIEAGSVGRANGLAIHLPGEVDRPWPDYTPERFAFLERVGWDELLDHLIAAG